MLLELVSEQRRSSRQLQLHNAQNAKVLATWILIVKNPQIANSVKKTTTLLNIIITFAILEANPVLTYYQSVIIVKEPIQLTGNTVKFIQLLKLNSKPELNPKPKWKFKFNDFTKSQSLTSEFKLELFSYRISITISY